MYGGLKAGDIGFVMKKDNKLSSLFAWFMGSSWCHTFLVLQVTEERVYTLETSDFEVSIQYFGQYDSKENVNYAVFRNEALTEEVIRIYLETAMIRHKEVYGYLQLISFAFRCLAKKIGFRIPNFFRQGVVCSGVVMTAYKDYFKLDPEEYDVEDLYQLVLKDRNFKLIRAQKC